LLWNVDVRFASIADKEILPIPADDMRRLKGARQWLSITSRRPIAALPSWAFGTRKTRMQPGHNGLRGAKAGYDAFLIKDAHKSEIQLHEATFGKIQYAELKM
jgi:hypothetical protein